MLLAPAFARRVRAATDWGPLVPDPDGLLDLPQGFSYRILQRTGELMNDGVLALALPDGMACFAGPDDTLILMRNHELFAGLGGVTRLVLDRDARLQTSNLVLAGTTRNCAGGPSPWGWLSCEETVDFGRGHVYLCDIQAEGVQPQQAIVGYGRFNHEAVAIDPTTSCAYLTEDRGNGCLYRFVPDDPGDPFTGRLQALRIVDGDAHTGGLDVGATATIDWIDIADPNPSDDNVRVQAQASGAAVFVRGEGIAYHDGRVVFACTTGGPHGTGQIFELRDDPTGGTLEVLAIATPSNGMVNPDNATFSPWGHVVVVEDRDGPCHIRVLDPSGDLVALGRVASGSSELAGICFSPDGRFMFVNSQLEGITYVIEGPFMRYLGDGQTPGGTEGGETGASSTTGPAAMTTAGTTSSDASSNDGARTTGPAGAATADGSGTAGHGDGSAPALAESAGGCSCRSTPGGSSEATLSGALVGGYAWWRRRSPKSASDDRDE